MSFGLENCKIALVELFPCASKMELERKEGEYIKNNDCVNKTVVGRGEQKCKRGRKKKTEEIAKQSLIYVKHVEQDTKLHTMHHPQKLMKKNQPIDCRINNA